jgi:hypothetical protein
VLGIIKSIKEKDLCSSGDQNVVIVLKKSPILETYDHTLEKNQEILKERQSKKLFTPENAPVSPQHVLVSQYSVGISSINSGAVISYVKKFSHIG